MRAVFRAIGRWITFVMVGLVTAAVGELQYSVFIRGDVANLIGSVVFNAYYLTLVFLLSRIVLRIFGVGRVAVLLHVALFGTLGLMVEWYLIGNSPWGNPDASQVGMFAYWTCLVVVPLVVLDPRPALRPLKRKIALFGLAYLGVAVLVEFLPGSDLQFVYHIWSVILGYLALSVFCIVGLMRGHGAAAHAAVPRQPSEGGPGRLPPEPLRTPDRASGILEAVASVFSQRATGRASCP